MKIILIKIIFVQNKFLNLLNYCNLFYIEKMDKTILKKTVRNSTKKLAKEIIAVGVAVEGAGVGAGGSGSDICSGHE